MFKLKNKSAIKKRIKITGNGKLLKYKSSGVRHGMMKSNRSKLSQKKRMQVVKRSQHQWRTIYKSMV